MILCTVLQFYSLYEAGNCSVCTILQFFSLYEAGNAFVHSSAILQLL